MISYMTFDFPSVGEDFFIVTDVEARAVEPQLGATNDNASDRSMDSDKAVKVAICLGGVRNFARQQFPRNCCHTIL